MHESWTVRMGTFLSVKCLLTGSVRLQFGIRLERLHMKLQLNEFVLV